MAQTILVVDFGGQYNQLIARRVRESCVYSEIVSYKKAFEAVREKKPAGIILTGGPNSAYLPDSPTIGRELFEMGIPVLARLPIDPGLAAACDAGTIEDYAPNYLESVAEKL